MAFLFGYYTFAVEENKLCYASPNSDVWVHATAKDAEEINHQFFNVLQFYFITYIIATVKSVAISINCFAKKEWLDSGIAILQMNFIL
mmetsp:Transcript_44248/g.42948  ORF Transcript_44248/g.42948 Transcript_44248/m.42948 type:complete len:88 (-) Transcript_44248:168-431(-)